MYAKSLIRSTSCGAKHIKAKRGTSLTLSELRLCHLRLRRLGAPGSYASGIARGIPISLSFPLNSMPKKGSAKKPKSDQGSLDAEQKKLTPGEEIDQTLSRKKRKMSKQECPEVEEGKPSSAVKKFTNEIDEIFAGKKKKPKQELPEKLTADVNSKSKNKKKSKKDKGGVISDPPFRSRKKTEDGLTIYTEEELGMGNSNAGGTPLCPFDCSCCF